MAGFRNDTVYGNNVDFSGGDPATPQVTTNGQLLIGSVVAPNIRVNTLTAGSGITISNGPGTITITNSSPGTTGTPTLDSAFWANTSGNLSNVTGDGTSYTVVFDNLTYGQNGSAYNTGTGIYTAPATGWYMFTYAMCLTGVTGSHTDCNCDLQTTDAFGLLYRSISNPAALKDPAGNVTVYDSRVVHLAAGNTIKVVVTVYSGAKVVGLLGPQAVVQMYTSFGGAFISK